MCDDCRFYKGKCTSDKRCINTDELNLIRSDAVKEFADWLVKYKVVDDYAMQELIRDFKGECGNG